MHFDKNEKTFHSSLLDFPENGKMIKLATVRVNCAPLGEAVIKLTIGISKKGNPIVSMRTIKPKTGETKKKTLMAVPVKPPRVIIPRHS